MKDVPLHLVPLLAAAIVRFVIGALWFSPLVFGKIWAVLSGCTEADIKRGMGKAMLVDFIGNFVLAVVLVHVIVWADAATALEGVTVAFMAWLAFIAMPLLSMVFWGKRPFKFYAIQVGFHLVSLLAMGALLAIWS